MKCLDVQVIYHHNAELRQTGKQTANRLQAATVFAAVRRLVRDRYGKDTRLTLSKQAVSEYALMYGNVVVAEYVVTELDYMEWYASHQAGLAEMEAHKPVALEGELMIAAWPKQQ